MGFNYSLISSLKILNIREIKESTLLLVLH